MKNTNKNDNNKSNKFTFKIYYNKFYKQIVVDIEGTVIMTDNIECNTITVSKKGKTKNEPSFYLEGICTSYIVTKHKITLDHYQVDEKTINWYNDN